MDRIFILCFALCLCCTAQGQRSIFEDSTQLAFFHGSYHGNWKPGKIKGRHTFLRNTGKKDPYSNEEIDIVPFGKRRILRLGNKSVGAQADRVTYTFRVTKESSLFVYQYAIILQDPKHDEEEQPYFEITITDSTGKVLDPKCGYYKVIAGAEAERKGFKLGPDKAMYKDWTTEALNLTPYIGKKIKVQFTVFDCEKTGHFGYAYMDAYYSSLEVKIKYCRGDEYATLIAPEGFANYQWSTGVRNAQRIVVPSSDIDKEFSCIITSVTGCQLTLDTRIVPQKLWVEAKPEIQPVSCGGQNDGQVRLSVINGFKPYKFLWSDGRDEQIRKDLAEGNYQVIISDAVNCKDTLAFTVKGPQKIKVKHIIRDNKCHGDSNGSIEIRLANSYKYDIQWDSLPATFTQRNLSAGKYRYTLQGKDGCSSDTIEIGEPSPLSLKGKVISDYDGYDVSCKGKQDGIVSWKLAGGTGPYLLEYLWSGDTLSLVSAHKPMITRNLAAGPYKVRLTDANQCLTQDSVLLHMPDTVAIHASVSEYEGYPIRCFGDSSGSIQVRLSDGTRSSGIYTYTWSNKTGVISNSRDLYNIPAGRYRLEIENKNGCKSSQTVILKNPPKIRIVHRKRISLGFIQNKKYEVVGGTAPYSLYLDEQEVDEFDIWGKKKQRHMLEATDSNDCRCELKVRYVRTRRPKPIKPVKICSRPLLRLRR